MVDLASLAIKIDTTEAGKAAADLNKVADSGGKAEDGVRKVTGASKALEAVLREAVSALDRNTASNLAMEKAATSATSAISSMARAASDMANEALESARATRQFSSDVAALKAKIDPAWGALEQYKKQVELLRKAQAEGALQQGQYIQEIRKAKTAYKEAADGLNETGKMSGSAAFAARNLSYQISDVIQGLATGQKPMQIFAQQGFQIADALGQLAAEARKADKSLLAMVAGPLAKFGPYIAAAAVAVGGLAAVLKTMQDEVNASNEATVSFGDVARGVFDGTVAYIRDKVGPAYEWLANLIGQAWQYVAQATKSTFNAIVTMATAAPNYIIAAFQTMPQAIAELFVNMANGAIEAIEDLINEAISGLNQFAGMVGGLFGRDFGSIGNVSFGRIENNFAGAGERFGAAMAQATADTFRDHFSDAVAYYKPFINNAAKRSIEDSAKDAGKKAGAAGGKAMADEWAEALKRHWSEVEKAISDILGETEKLVADIMTKSDDELGKVLEAANDNYSDAAQKAIDLAEAHARWNEEVRRTVDMLDQLGGTGRTLGSILLAFQGLRTGDFSGVPGPAGVLLQTLGDIQWSTKDGEIKKLGEEIFASLDKVFGGNGVFERTLTNLFGGAAVGSAVSSVLGGGKGGDIGGTLGGAAGMAIGGPVGALVGSVLGNLVGGVFNSTKRGGAVISGGSLSGTFGNSDSRIGGSSTLAGGVLDALGQIANALGGTVGAYNAVIGIRKDSLRYNSTGANSTKLSRGAIDFGQDEEALLRHAIKDAIAQGTFEGLSDGVKRLIEAPGDIEANLQKALDLRGVYSDLAQAKDPQGFELDQLEQWRDRMVDIAMEAGEGMAEVEELYGLRRKEILDRFGADDEARRELEIALMVAQGKEMSALAAVRQMELDALPESLRALQEQVWAEQDAATKRAAIAAKEQAIGQERQALNLEILRMLGRTEQVRKIELSALDESNRHLQERIWALQAEQEATAAAAAASLARANERVGIETKIHQLLGNTSMIRMQELDALDPANRALQQHYYNLLDEAAAADEAARATADLASQQRAIADERYSLETRLLQAMGDTASLRARELAALDESNRPLLKQIYAIEDYKIAQEAAANAAQDAANATISQNNALIASYNDQASAASRLASTFRDLAAEIRSYRAGLFGNAPGVAQGEFQRISRMASLGDEASLRAFTGSADRYLEEARNSAGTFVEYQRAVGLVARAADQAAAGADGVARMAESQLAAAQSQVAALEQANVMAQLEADAAKAQAEENIKALAGIEGKQDATIEEIDFGTEATIDALAEVKTAVMELRQQIAAQRTAEQAESVQMVSALNSMERRLSRWDGGDYVRIGNESDAPVYTDEVP